MGREWIKLFIPYSESENVATREAIEGGKSLAITDIGRLSWRYTGIMHNPIIRHSFSHEIFGFRI